MSAWGIGTGRRRTGGFRIGDTVGLKELPAHNSYRWDGTVVDVIEDQHSPLFRVYWRYPLGKVADYRSPELVRR